jgi:hypothetical protein
MERLKELFNGKKIKISLNQFKNKLNFMSREIKKNLINFTNNNLRTIIKLIRNIILTVLIFPLILIIIVFPQQTEFTFTIEGFSRLLFSYYFLYLLQFIQISLFTGILLNFPLYIPKSNRFSQTTNRFIKRIELKTRDKIHYILVQVLLIFGIVSIIIVIESIFDKQRISIIYITTVIFYLLFYISYTLLDNYEYCQVNLERYLNSKDPKYLQNTLIRLNIMFSGPFSVQGIYQLVGIITLANKLKDDVVIFDPQLEKLLSSITIDEKNIYDISQNTKQLFVISKKYSKNMENIITEPNIPLQIRIKSNYSNITLEIIKGVAPILIVIFFYWIAYTFWGIRLPMLP